MSKSSLPSAVRRISKRTKKARTSAGLTRRAVAAALGLSLKTYERYEHDQALPYILHARFSLLTRCAADFLCGEFTPSKAEQKPSAVILAPANKCGKPCSRGTFWCRSECDKA